jgi:hypothetical protein
MVFPSGPNPKLHRVDQQELCNYSLPIIAWLPVMSHKNMVMSAMGPRTKNECAGEDQQQITAIILVIIICSYEK